MEREGRSSGEKKRYTGEDGDVHVTEVVATDAVIKTKIE